MKSSHPQNQAANRRRRSLLDRAQNSVGQFLLRNVLMRGKHNNVAAKRSSEPRIKAVEVLLPDKTVVGGKFIIWSNDPQNPEVGRVDLQFLDKQFTGYDVSFNYALNNIRREIEPQGILLRCYGSSRTVHASGMSSSMGRGGFAYRMDVNIPMDKRLVSIFDSGSDVDPCTIEEQDQFFRQSLVNSKDTPSKKIFSWKHPFAQSPFKTLKLYLQQRSK